MEEYWAVQQDTYMTALTKCLNERLSEISGLHRKNTQLYQELSQVEELLFRAEQENAALKEQLQFCQEQREEAGKKLHSAIEELETVRQELHQEKEKAAQESTCLQEKIRQMENSKSWKITKPLRMLIWKIKG